MLNHKLSNSSAVSDLSNSIHAKFYYINANRIHCVPLHSHFKHQPEHSVIGYHLVFSNLNVTVRFKGLQKHTHEKVII
jgi:hypothetical protein